MYARSASPDLREIKQNLNLATDSRHRQCKTADYQSTTTQKKSLAEANKKNHDFCDACGGAGQFLCCDACPNAFHLTCVEPPMDTEDLDKLSDNWYCNECEHKRVGLKKAKSKRSKSKYTGMFRELVDDMEKRNPLEYRLPNDIINFFEHVAADKEGDYIDTSMTKRVRYKHGQPEQPDYYALKDKNGDFIVCYQCRKTALRKPMVHCDFCPLYWHLDCLNPPMASPPNPAKKWRCPNHIEHIIKPPRKQKKPIVVDSQLPSSAYHNYISNVIDDSPPVKRTTKAKQKDAMEVDHDESVSEKFVIDFAKYTKKAIEEARKRRKNAVERRRQSIPSSTLTSSSSEWLENMAFFQAGGAAANASSHPTIRKDATTNITTTTKLPHNDPLRALIETATKPLPPPSMTKNNKRKKIDPEKYKLYVQIDKLLQQKSPDELYTLLSKSCAPTCK
ncbi:hypothetical protein MUCCIDRAFT_163595 [Mucor lusitanicus CBS 277.49]|uniref:PHD-type domain-containing protein n=1 Tax=Mucor lusitanicus CBS 277.49 TaxID=747725 RepID=A0A162QM10_MUCCL|nr:hypothetical protein MUCCIDRAFT_163595 [Mucor lusitanicus CBS 277.49]